MHLERSSEPPLAVAQSAHTVAMLCVCMVKVSVMFAGSRCVKVVLVAPFSARHKRTTHHL